ncbi:transposase [Chromobacterium sp. IIBBL 290-4]|uniref:transposase n=1 Tax=Chromobacterium sp. IIBBL 290-4 TaxID=2953890 RepID=UPI0020B6A93B|nr:transposase [Chromobacterium sp. IIBBL 290-4]UTH76426.1 transposase [Chromobacterium sp. IIBBL 290-4]
MADPTDLAERQWHLIARHFQPTNRRGRPCKHDKQLIVNAILYLSQSGCQWRMLPTNFPPWQTVYDHFSRWNKQGIWERALDELTRAHRRQRKKVDAQLWHR